MKFAITSDWHGSLPLKKDLDAISKADVLLLAGDIFEANRDPNIIIDYLTNEFISNHGKAVIYTPGNHDLAVGYSYCQKNPSETFTTNFDVFRFFDKNRNQVSKESLENKGIICLINEVISFNGIKIFGTPWTPTFGPWAFMAGESDLLKKYRQIPKNANIVISHGPPKPLNDNNTIDIALEYDRTEHKHLGSTALYQAIIETKPEYLFCGHIHSGDHDETIIGNTKCYNVSYFNEQYEPGYEIKFLDI